MSIFDDMLRVTATTVLGAADAFTRAIQYQVTDTDTKQTQTYFVNNTMGPGWPTGMRTYGGGMSVPAAWRAANLLSEMLGEIPYHAYRSQRGKPLVQLDPDPVLLEQPSPPDSSMETWSSLGLDLIWEGNAVGIWAGRNFEGWPTSILPVPARTVHVKRDALGRIKYRIGDREYDWTEIFHVKGPHEPGSLRGMGVLEAHMNGALTLALEQQKQATTVSRSDGVPTGLLTTESETMTRDELGEQKQYWLEAQQTRTIAALGAGTKFQPIAWKPDDLQLIEARTFSLTEIELIFGLPPGWLGGMNSARQYSNIEQDVINLLRFSLGGHLTRFEQKLSLAFPRGTKVRGNLDAFLRPDTLARYQAHQIGITAGFLTRDEAREYENKPPLTAAQKSELDARNPKEGSNNGGSEEDQSGEGAEG